MASEICLTIDYRDKTISWRPWSETDREGTVYNRFTGDTALFTRYRVRNTLTDIRMALMRDPWASEDVLFGISDGTIRYGDRFVISPSERRIYIPYTKDSLGRTAYIIYGQNKETEELETL